MSETIARLKIYEIMKDGRWRSLPDLERALGHRYMVTSISARLRDFRKAKHGSYVVESRPRVGQPHTYEYRLVVPGFIATVTEPRARRSAVKPPPARITPGQSVLFEVN